VRKQTAAEEVTSWEGGRERVGGERRRRRRRGANKEIMGGGGMKECPAQVNVQAVYGIVGRVNVIVIW